MEMLNSEGFTEIQRNELAQTIGCVPSQINYVISSRFTPEMGYIVESRRGGGGYIRITRAPHNVGAVALMHLINSIGQEIDETTCRAHISNLAAHSLVSGESARLMAAAVSENCYRELDPSMRDAVRAGVFKQMLLQIANNIK